MKIARGPWLFCAMLLFVSPVSAQQRWTLTEGMRIGSLDEGPAMFSDVRGFVVQRNGDVWVLDYKTQDIRIFDATGSYAIAFGLAAGSAAVAAWSVWASRVPRTQPG